MVPAAGAEGSPLAHHAASRHDAAYLGKLALGAGTLRRRHARDPGGYFAKKPIRTEYLVVDKGKLAGVGAHSYTAGDATKGSEEAAKFKKENRSRRDKTSAAA